MKTRGLSDFSATLGNKPPVQLHSHGSFHRKGKLKGWMRENRRSTFNNKKL